MNKSLRDVSPLLSDRDPITPDTAEQYEQRARALIARAKADPRSIRVRSLQDMASMGTANDLDRVVHYLRNLAPSVSYSTFRQYKAALSHFLVKHHPEAETARRELADLSYGKVYRRVHERLARQGIPRTKKVRRTSAQKAKGISQQDMNRIEARFEAINSNKARLTLAWLKAGLATGLRPQEWCNAALTPCSEGQLLTIRNLKCTQDRSFAKTRQLIIADPERIAIIEKQLELFRLRQAEVTRAMWAIPEKTSEIDPEAAQRKRDQAVYQRIYTECRQLLSAEVRRLFPRRTLQITLYSGRHQFAADAKKTYQKPVVAALLGHGSLHTAAQHYGLSARGSDLPVKPAQETYQALSRRLREKKPGIDIPDVSAWPRVNAPSPRQVGRSPRP